MRQDMETLACIVSWLADGESLGVKLARRIECAGDSTCGVKRGDIEKRPKLGKHDDRRRRSLL